MSSFWSRSSERDDSSKRESCDQAKLQQRRSNEKIRIRLLRSKKEISTTKHTPRYYLSPKRSWWTRMIIKMKGSSLKAIGQGILMIQLMNSRVLLSSSWTCWTQEVLQTYWILISCPNCKSRSKAAMRSQDQSSRDLIVPKWTTFTITSWNLGSGQNYPLQNSRNSEMNTNAVALAEMWKVQQHSPKTACPASTATLILSQEQHKASL